ncbi:hypothetical protein AMTRI_Chr09g21950 [Amborella trichopoda]
MEGEEESFAMPPTLLNSTPSIAEIVVFRDEEDSDEKADCRSASSGDSDADPTDHRGPRPLFIDPDPHISTQFYTFNKESHNLMVHCILEQRLATPEEIKRATPNSILLSWRGVWKDRNVDTAYLTGWKRIQEKLNAHIDENGNEVLYFKNNSHQFVSHVDQWQDIVMGFHGDADLKHLGLKESVERIKQVWTVGAKFYGIPESFIRVCVASCPVCSDVGSSAPRNKRRRFEYTESFEVPAKEVPERLQQLAAKHKVVLCIRQKYIRYKPFMAEVKDYACHRAGEPTSKRSRIVKREPYVSKRCGCAFRIRAIVPIANYNEKDKTFVYQEEGMAIFKLYAVHSGHEPGALDGNARIIHRLVGAKEGGFTIMEHEPPIYGDSDTFGLMRKEESDSQLAMLQQVQELRTEIGLLESKITKIPHELLASLSQEISSVMSRLRSMREVSRSEGLLIGRQHSDEVLIGDPGLGHWGEQHIRSDGKDGELIEEEDDAFEHSLDEVASWDRLKDECRERKDIIRGNTKTEKWLDSVKEACGEFDEKTILDCEDSKLIKPIRHDGTIVTDANLVGLPVVGFYADNTKWYDSPCGLDTGTDCGDGGFRHGSIV